jgi:RNA-directed DNA polymerase
MNGQSTCAPIDQTVSWHSINWAMAYGYVRRMQARIVKAAQEGRWNKVKSLQRMLTSSFYGKALAVRRVTENQGKRTPGVDEETWSTPGTKTAAIASLKRHGYKPRPLRRIYIPKSNGKMRPLSIPTMRDRAMQALYLLALDPVSEVVSDGQSYGFRKERSTHDAIAQCFLNARYFGNPKDGKGSRQSAQWILEGDIRGCFDNIDHDWLINNVPMDKVMLKKWLKAGYMEGNALAPTNQGTPQGGIISPVLANFALNGLEAVLRGEFKNEFQFKKAKVNLVRYADDFVITGVSKDLLESCIKPAVTGFLATRGLELSPEKTKISHITEGYDFLGQNVRRYNKKLLIKPSVKNVKAFLTKVRGVIKKLAAAPQQQLIKALNPMIVGWTLYHRHVVAKKTFSNVGSQIWYALWQWAKRRHPKKTAPWIRPRYFHRIGHRHWVFAVDTGEKRTDGTAIHYFLRSVADMPIDRHQKIKSDANPYDPHWEQYFEKRATWKMTLSLGGRKKLVNLWLSQQGKCLVCRQTLHPWQWHKHHLLERSRGGKAVASNEVLLHDVCHKQVHNQGIKLQKPGPWQHGPL